MRPGNERLAGLPRDAVRWRAVAPSGRVERRLDPDDAWAVHRHHVEAAGRPRRRSR